MAGKALQAKDEPADAEIVQAAVGNAEREGDHLSRYLATEVEDTETTALQTHAAIIHQILNAPDIDSVLEVFEPQKLEDFENRIIEIHGFQRQESDFDQGPRFYMSVKVIDVENGTRHLINVGEQGIMAQLIRLDQLATFPIKVRVHMSKTANKYGRRLARFGKADA